MQRVKQPPTLKHIFYRGSTVRLELGVSRNTCVTCPGSFRKLTKGNYSKIIDARVMDLTHDSWPAYSLSTYEVSFQYHQLNLSYCIRTEKV